MCSEVVFVVFISEVCYLIEQEVKCVYTAVCIQQWYSIFGLTQKQHVYTSQIIWLVLIALSNFVVLDIKSVFTGNLKV